MKVVVVGGRQVRLRDHFFVFCFFFCTFSSPKKCFVPPSEVSLANGGDSFAPPLQVLEILNLLQQECLLIIELFVLYWHPTKTKDSSVGRSWRYPKKQHEKRSFTAIQGTYRYDHCEMYSGMRWACLGFLTKCPVQACSCWDLQQTPGGGFGRIPK